PEVDGRQLRCITIGNCKTCATLFISVASDGGTDEGRKVRNCNHRFDSDAKDETWVYCPVWLSLALRVCPLPASSAARPLSPANLACLTVPLLRSHRPPQGRAVWK